MASLGMHLRAESLLLLNRVGLGRPIGWKPLSIHVLLIAAFGVLIPWLKGVEFMDPALPTIYACLGPFFGAPAVVQLLREGTPEWYACLAKILVACAYGEVTALIMLGLGFLTVLAGHPQAYLFLPDVITLGKATLLGLGATLALTSVAAWLTLQFSMRLAMTVLRVVFVLLFVFFFLRSWWLPSVLGTALSISLGLAVIFLELVRRRSAA